MWSLSILWLQMSHFIRSVSDHGKCSIKLKLSNVRVHSHVIWEFSVVAMATGDKNLSKQGKMVIFVILCDT